MRRELLELEGSPYLMLQPFPSVLGGPRRLLGWGVAGEEEDGGKGRRRDQVEDEEGIEMGSIEV